MRNYTSYVGNQYRFQRIVREGYRIRKLGNNIEATKNEISVRGSLNRVYKILFGRNEK